MTSVQDHPAALRGQPSYQQTSVTQVGGVIGAVVGGIRIGGAVDPRAVAELRAALLRHKVVFLRGPAARHRRGPARVRAAARPADQAASYGGR